MRPDDRAGSIPTGREQMMKEDLDVSPTAWQPSTTARTVSGVRTDFGLKYCRKPGTLGIGPRDSA